MDNPKNQAIERLKKANNILVTVSASPSVDQLCAAIGLTLILNHQGKHATAVFSGQIPSTMEFLKPEDTLEKTTDSLRDFIIALDKSKADKLRYKVEDEMVKIFITPYRTSITDKDLDFSQGDFNVEVVLAIGVNEQTELDQAITTHGRILHDATIIGVSTNPANAIGSINWNDDKSSSLSEMATSLGIAMKPDVLESQSATALLTGIVAETDRFSNAKTASETMQISAKLMAAGANQQLVASELSAVAAPAEQAQTIVDKPVEPDVELPEPATEQAPEQQQEPEPQSTPQPEQVTKPKPDGSLLIDHGDANLSATVDDLSNGDDSEPVDQIHIDDEGVLKTTAELEAMKNKIVQQQPAPAPVSNKSESRLITEPPTMGGQLTANTEAEGLEPSTDILGTPSNDGPILSHDAPPASTVAPTLQPLAPSIPAPDSQKTIEQTVASPQVGNAQPENIADARGAVDSAMTGSMHASLAPIHDLNLPPMNLDTAQLLNTPPIINDPAKLPTLDEPVVVAPQMPISEPQATVSNPTAPPSVPPPMMPPTNMPVVEPPKPSDTAL